METGALTHQPTHGRIVRRRRTPRGLGVAAAGLALASGVGLLAGIGQWPLAIAALAVPAFMLTAAAAPERTALGLIVALPFFFYPVTVGGFSLFLALPTFGFVSVLLLMRAHPPLGAIRRELPVLGFAVLLAVAIASSAVSADSVRGFSRIAYLLLFGVFAYAIAGSLIAGRMDRTAIARAMLLAGGLAAVAVVIQFAAQFGVGEGRVLDWLFDVEAAFAGERAAEVRKSNWVVADLDMVRGIFPFMSPPAAGQFLMFSLIAGVWLRRESRRGQAAASTLELVAVALVGAALLLTFSRQAWLGAAVGIVALALGRRPLFGLAVTIQVVLVLSIVPIPGSGGSFGDYLLSAGDTSTESSATRLDLWEQAIDLIPEHAALGAGPGQIETLAPGGPDQDFYAHNVFLDAAVELGIVGGLALIAVFVRGLSSALRNGAALGFALLAAYAVAGLFDDVLYTPRNGLMLALAFALTVAVAQRHPPPTGTVIPDDDR